MSDTPYTAADACRDAQKFIDEADRIANSDSGAYSTDRHVYVQSALLRAQALALVSIAANLETIKSRLTDDYLVVRAWDG
jgi:hypothetical protein